MVRIEEDRTVLNTLEDTPSGKRPLGRLKCKWRIVLEYILKRYVSIGEI
jgi:hypothetical protein